MAISNEIMDSYIALLHHELAAAEGCTEPIAIAYGGALCTQTLGSVPETLQVALSGNIIKNARCAVIPNTGGLRGMKAAAIAGAVAGDASKKLEVIAGLSPAQITRINDRMGGNYCTVSLLDTTEPLHILMTASAGTDTCCVEIKHAHTNIHRIEKNGALLYDAQNVPEKMDEEALYALLNLDDIYSFVETVALSRVQDLLALQLHHNIAICEEGLKNDYGANIGRLILESDESIEARACAYAAAGSDARMSGCPMPTVINSGSGNQGITVTAPVWVYAQYLNAGQEKLLRALLLSNLVALLQKKMIGKLSAYCGAVSAACGSGAAITYLYGGTKEQIGSTLSNATVTVSGMLCDGAKPSCAAKIASAVHAAIMGHKMAMKNKNFLPGDGLVSKNPEQTVNNIGYLASHGLVEIDKLMLELMIKQDQS